MPGAPSSASTQSPESSESATSPEACAAARAFSRALSLKGRSRLLGLLETERRRAERRDAEGLQQFVKLSQLAGIVGGDDEAAR